MQERSASMYTHARGADARSALPMLRKRLPYHCAAAIEDRARHHNALQADGDHDIGCDRRDEDSREADATRKQDAGDDVDGYSQSGNPIADFEGAFGHEEDVVDGFNHIKKQRHSEQDDDLPATERSSPKARVTTVRAVNQKASMRMAPMMLMASCARTYCRRRFCACGASGARAMEVVSEPATRPTALNSAAETYWNLA